MNPLLKSMLDLWMPVIRKLAGQPTTWFVLFVGIVVAVCRLPIVKGWLGEKLVSLLLKWCLDKRRYTLIDNVTIPDGEGGTTQIDHVVASPYGVFVIETKNLGGWIFGR